MVTRQALLVLLLVANLNSANAHTDQPVAADSAALSKVLTISGRTEHPVLKNAVVEVRAGDQSVAVTTDRHGRYTASLDCQDAKSLVIVRATGVGSQSTAGGARVVHSCEELLARGAGDDSYEIGPINPVSTGLYLIASQTLQVLEQGHGKWRSNHLAPYRFSMQIEKLLNIALVIVLYDLPDFDAPEGAPTVTALLNSPESINTALNRNIHMLNDPQVEGYIDFFWRDPALFKSVITMGWPGSITLSCARLMRGRCAERLASKEDGTVLYQSDWGTAQAVVRRGALLDRIHSDRFDEREPPTRFLRVTGHAGNPVEVMHTTYSFSGATYPALRETIWLDVYALDASEFIPLAATVPQYLIRFHENPELTPVLADREWPQFRSASFDQSELPEWNDPYDGEQRVMTFGVDPEPPMDTSIIHSMDVVTFSDSGLAWASRQNTTWTWSIHDSMLTLEHPERPMHRYRLLRAEVGLPHQVVMLETLHPDNELVVTIEESIVVTETLQFEEADVPGRYVSGMDLDDFHPRASRLDPADFFTFHLRPDGTGWNASMLDPSGPEPEGSRPLGWELTDDGELIITVEYSSIFRQIRSWRPVRQADSNTLYVFEVGPGFVEEDPAFQMPSTTGRLNYYRRLPL